MSDMSPSPQPFLERLSDGLQHLIQVVIGSQRKLPRRLRSFLNGTWFGHPLHPVITDVPITAWLLTAVFDIIWLIAHTTWAAYGGFVTVIVGLLGALGAFATGLTDWSDTYGSERHVGFNHLLFNTGALLLYLVSFLLRLIVGPGDGVAAAIIGFVGLGCVLYAGYLGGEMVFTKGTGVNHTAWEAASEDYEAVIPFEKVEEQKLHFPFDLIQVQGYSPTAAGAALVPFLLLVFLFSRWAEGLVDRYGARLPLVPGPVITAVGFALFAVPTIGGSYWVTFFPIVLLKGVGMAINVAPMTTVVMEAVEQRHADIASAINNAVARAASLLAIAVLGIVIVSVFTSSLDSHLAHLQLGASARHLMEAQRGKLAGMQLPADGSGELQASLKQAVAASFVSGFRLVALLCAGLALASALCGWVMIGGKRAGRGVPAGKASKTDSPYARIREE